MSSTLEGLLFSMLWLASEADTLGTRLDLGHLPFRDTASWAEDKAVSPVAFLSMWVTGGLGCGVKGWSATKDE